MDTHMALFRQVSDDIAWGAGNGRHLVWFPSLTWCEYVGGYGVISMARYKRLLDKLAPKHGRDTDTSGASFSPMAVRHFHGDTLIQPG